MRNVKTHYFEVVSNILRRAVLTGAAIIIFIGPLFARRFSKYPFEDKYYPVWANHLFAGFPHLMQNFAIVIHEVDGKRFAPGVDFYSLFPTLEGAGLSPSIVIDQIGQALEFGREREFLIAKKTFEAKLLSSHTHVLYSVHKTNWVPLERYFSGSFKLNKVLRNVEFSKTNN